MVCVMGVPVVATAATTGQIQTTTTTTTSTPQFIPQIIQQQVIRPPIIRQPIIRPPIIPQIIAQPTLTATRGLDWCTFQELTQGGGVLNQGILSQGLLSQGVAGMSGLSSLGLLGGGLNQGLLGQGLTGTSSLNLLSLLGGGMQGLNLSQQWRMPALGGTAFGVDPSLLLGLQGLQSSFNLNGGLTQSYLPASFSAAQWMTQWSGQNTTSQNLMTRLRMNPVTTTTTTTTTVPVAATPVTGPGWTPTHIATGAAVRRAGATSWRV